MGGYCLWQNLKIHPKRFRKGDSGRNIFAAYTFMLNESDLIASYEDMLLGSNPTFKQDFFVIQKKSEQKAVIALCRYVFKDLLDMGPRETQELCSKELLCKFELWDLIEKSVEFEPGMTEKEQCEYIAHLCYPKDVGFNKRKYIVGIYEDVMAGKMKYPKLFFSDKAGMIRGCICLQYVLDKYYSFTTIADLYKLFNDEDKATVILKKNKLFKACFSQYDTALDFLHYSFPTNRRNTFLYNYYKFKRIWDSSNTLPKFTKEG